MIFGGLILWGLGASVARAEPDTPAPSPPEVTEAAPPQAADPVGSEYERLLGSVPSTDEPAPEASPRPIIDTFSWWPIGAAGAIALGVWWLRRRLEQKQADTGSELRVVGRADLGSQSGLSVVEVRDRSGSWRRLVIGTGDGPPQLVADLGEPQFGLLGEDDEATVEEPAERYSPGSQHASLHGRAPIHRGDRSSEGRLPHDFDSYEPLPSPSEAGLPPLPVDPRAGGTNPRSGRALVHEVLGERRKGRPSRRSTSFQTFA